LTSLYSFESERRDAFFSFSNVTKKLIAECNSAWMRDGDSQSMTSSTTTAVTQSLMDNVATESDVGNGNGVSMASLSMKREKLSEFVLLPHQVKML
jgi:hypothetical protein